MQQIPMHQIIDNLAKSHDRAKVFRDFLTMAAEFLQGKPSPKLGYNADELALFQAFYGGLLDLYAKEPKDHLGELYMTLAIESSKSKGQYFTPDALGAISQNLMTDDEIHTAIHDKGYVSLHEPSCGSGALIIAFANRLRKMGLSPANHLAVYAKDLDQKSVLMSFVGASLLGIPLMIDWGDTLENTCRQRYVNFFYRRLQRLGVLDVANTN